LKRIKKKILAKGLKNGRKSRPMERQTSQGEYGKVLDRSEESIKGPKDRGGYDTCRGGP